MSSSAYNPRSAEFRKILHASSLLFALCVGVDSAAGLDNDLRTDLLAKAKVVTDKMTGEFKHEVANQLCRLPGHQCRCDPGDKYCVYFWYEDGMFQVEPYTMNNALTGTASSQQAQKDGEEKNDKLSLRTREIQAALANLVLVETAKREQTDAALREDVHQDLTQQIGQVLTPDLRTQIIEDAAKEATIRVLAKLCEQGVIVGPACQ